MPGAPPSPLPPSTCRALRRRALVASSASASCTRRSSASCAARRSSVCAASGGLYEVPACGAGTAGNAIAARGLGTSGAYTRRKRKTWAIFQLVRRQDAMCDAHTLTLTPSSSNLGFVASADHMSYCPLCLTASETSRSALPSPGCEGSMMLFRGPLRSFRAILSSRSFSRELTRGLRGRAWTTAGTAER